MCLCLLITFHCEEKARWALKRQELEGIFVSFFSTLSSQEATNLTCPLSSDFMQVNAKSYVIPGMQAGMS